MLSPLQEAIDERDHRTDTVPPNFPRDKDWIVTFLTISPNGCTFSRAVERKLSQIRLHFCDKSYVCAETPWENTKNGPWPPQCVSYVRPLTVVQDGNFPSD